MPGVHSDREAAKVDDEIAAAAAAAPPPSSKKKKKKKKKKKQTAQTEDDIFAEFAALDAANAANAPKVAGSSSAAAASRVVDFVASKGSKFPYGENFGIDLEGSDETSCRLLYAHGGGPKSFLEKYPQQTWPPSVPIEDFSDGPLGEIHEYEGENAYRFRDAECLAREKLGLEVDLRDVRIASECHRQTRMWVQSWIKPGLKLADVCELLENKNRELLKENGLKAGPGFPTGCSLNHVAAHYTPNSNDDTTLSHGDVCKIDFGTQINGRIVDCAFTVAFDSKYDSLLQTVKDATEAGVAAAGIDARLNEIGGLIHEVMEAGELDLEDGSGVKRIKPCENLNGHSIGRYRIHAGKSVPIVRGGPEVKMEENEFYAIETFGTTGRGRVVEVGECSHYMRNFEIDPKSVALRTQGARKLLAHITKTFGTLAFCRRWLDRPDGGSFAVNGASGAQPKHLMSLKQLVDAGVVDPYPPLCDVSGSLVAQYEHTLVLRPTCKEVLSRGADF